MNRRNLWALVLFFVLRPAMASAIEEKMLSELKSFIARFSTSGGPEAKLGFTVVALSNDDEVLSERQDEPFIPASLQKLVLALTALRALGANYRFPNEIFLDHHPTKVDPEGRERVDFAPPVKSVGNMYFRGYGDPALGSAEIDEIARSLFRSGVTRVDDVIVDDTLLIQPAKSTGPNPSDAGLSAVTNNRNAYAVYVAPARSASPAFVSLTPGLSFHLINQVLTIRGSEQSISIDTTARPLREIAEDALSPAPTGTSVNVTVRGVIGVQTPPMILWQSLPDIAAAFRELLGHALKTAGIEVTGKVKMGEVPPSAALFQSFPSKPLSEIVRTMNHESDNVSAGQILYALGQDDRGYFRSDLGLKRVRKQLEQLAGARYGEFELFDGSGFDRRNKLTPRQIVLVLKDAAKDLSVSPDFISSLPRFGEGGTLKSRELLSPEIVKTLRGEELRSAKVRAKAVWAKTGTLEGVSGLAGYALTRGGERVAFVVMENDVKDKIRAAAFEDGFVRTLIGVSGSPSETDIPLR